MLASPFIQVEGAIALPRVYPLGPLNRLSATVGREWTLTRPHFSLRAEIRALDAAVMRTVCLSVEAFREACRWDMQHHFLPVPAAAPIRPVAPGGASHAPARAKAPTGVNAAPSVESRRAPHGRPPHRFAGGACALGGAALLAWIVASNTPHNGDAPISAADTHPSHDASDTTSQRLADTRAEHEHALATAPHSAGAGAMPHAGQSGKAVAKSTQPAASTVASGIVDTSPVALPSGKAPSYAGPGRRVVGQPATLPELGAKVEPSRASAAQKTAQGHSVRERASAGNTPRVETSRHAARTVAPHRVVAPATARRATGMHSEAGGFSPRQPGARHDSEYESIATYASTYTPQRPAVSASVPVDSSEWVNHVSHRRVTEIPDRFSK
jgi:hypothetical protein